MLAIALAAASSWWPTDDVHLVTAPGLAFARGLSTISAHRRHHASMLAPGVLSLHVLPPDKPSAWAAPTANMRVSSVLPAPVWRGQTGSNLALLRRCVLGLVLSALPGVNKSNAGGGWHSHASLFDNTGPIQALLSEACRGELGRLQSAIGARVREFGEAALDRENTLTTAKAEVRVQLEARVVEGWANVHGRLGASNSAHTHGTADVSGVMYVDDGGDAGACTLVQGPRGGELCNAPTAGGLLLFPGWLRHAVRPYMPPSECVREGNQAHCQRISISFNCKLELTTTSGAAGGGGGGRSGGGVGKLDEPVRRPSSEPPAMLWLWSTRVSHWPLSSLPSLLPSDLPSPLLQVSCEPLPPLLPPLPPRTP